MEFVDVRLLVQDIERTTSFYRETFGLSPRVLVEREYVEFDTAPATLAAFRVDLMARVLRERAAEPGGRVVVVIKVEDVDATHAELRARGVGFVTEPHDQDAWGLRVCHLRDPDGHIVELYHPLRPTP